MSARLSEKRNFFLEIKVYVFRSILRRSRVQHVRQTVSWDRLVCQVSCQTMECLEFMILNLMELTALAASPENPVQWPGALTAQTSSVGTV